MKNPIKHPASPPEPQAPDIYFDPMAKLVPEERAKLRGILSDPTYVKWLRIVEGQKPSSNCPTAGSGTRDAFSNERANARLGEIRGWEMHTAAMYLALAEPRQPRTETESTFSAGGSINLEPRIPDHKQ